MTTVITADRLTKAFGPHGRRPTSTSRSHRGEVFAFLGPNGGASPPRSACCWVCLTPAPGWRPSSGSTPCATAAAIHRRVGYLPGDLALHPTSHRSCARRVCSPTFGSLVIGRLLYAACGTFLPHPALPVRTLSGIGKIVCFPLAFMHRPDLLILDEPTAGLDPLMQHEFALLVRETVDEGRTVFLSSHELDEVQRIVDRVTIIKDGHTHRGPIPWTAYARRHLARSSSVFPTRRPRHPLPDIAGVRVLVCS